jgi:5'-deoxynucleotidase YfbR-like HD superfamily hydrolase
MDPDIKAEFAALHERLDKMETSRLEPTTRRVREMKAQLATLQAEFREYRNEFTEHAKRVEGG